MRKMKYCEKTGLSDGEDKTEKTAKFMCLKKRVLKM